jgi:16S rRNA C967 or C1407 C5-methylase (RsmB/RsmF family)
MNPEMRVVRTAFLEWLHGSSPIEKCLNECFQENRIGARDRKNLRKRIYGFLRFFGDVVKKAQSLSGIEASRLFESSFSEFLELQTDTNFQKRCLERHEKLKPRFEKDPLRHLAEVHGLSVVQTHNSLSESDLEFLHLSLHTQMQEPVLSLRCDMNSFADTESYVEKKSHLTKLGFHPYTQMPGAYFRSNLSDDPFQNPENIPFEVHFQDFSSQLVSWIVDPKPEELILDFCAGAGGKTKHMLDISNSQSRIWAYDNQFTRIKSLVEYAKKQNKNNLKVFFDKQVSEIGDGKFDKVLIDAPCSGLGTLRRHPDLIFRQKPQSLELFPLIQKEILINSLKYLKPGGVLTYSTCTFRPEENFSVIREILNIDRGRIKLLDIRNSGHSKIGGEILALAENPIVRNYLDKLGMSSVGLLVPTEANRENNFDSKNHSQTSGAWIGDGFFIAQLQLLE